MPAPTVQAVARAILRDWGILYLDPATPTNQTNRCRAIDLEDAALVMTQAFQEIAAEAGSKARTQPGGGVLYAPTTVTLTVTDGSTTISALTTYAAWMRGCTIRIAGDAQDNELISSTKLARPFIGTGGSVAGTVYGDAITLDETTGKVLSPMLAADGSPIQEVTTRHDFITRGGWNVPQFYNEGYASYPFWSIAPKAIDAKPAVFFTDNYYDSTLDYITRRIRFSPMPSARQSVAWTASINPMRVAITDISTGSPFTDPGVKIPCLDGWIESIFLPVARQIATSRAQFKNEEMRQEIGRQYKVALRLIQDADASVAPARTIYY